MSAGSGIVHWLPPGPWQRGLAYGDGVFESMRVAKGGIRLWPRHCARLCAGALRLGLPAPDGERLYPELRGRLPAEGVLKLLLLAAPTARGYRREDAESVLLGELHPLPPAATTVRLQSSAVRLPDDPLLAGIKHLNRLHQVLAWREVGEGREPLLCDTREQVVGTGAGNLFVRLGQRWWTPPVDRCGIAGVLRAELLARAEASGRPIGVDAIPLADLRRAEAAAVSNAVRGLRAVVSWDDRALAVDPVVELAELLDDP